MSFGRTPQSRWYDVARRFWTNFGTDIFSELWLTFGKVRLAPFAGRSRVQRKNRW